MNFFQLNWAPRLLGVPLFMGRIVDPSGKRKLGTPAARSSKLMAKALRRLDVPHQGGSDGDSESIRFPDERGR